MPEFNNHEEWRAWLLKTQKEVPPKNLRAGDLIARTTETFSSSPAMVMKAEYEIQQQSKQRRAWL